VNLEEAARSYLSPEGYEQNHAFAELARWYWELQGKENDDHLWWRNAKEYAKKVLSEEHSDLA